MKRYIFLLGHLPSLIAGATKIPAALLGVASGETPAEAWNLLQASYPAMDVAGQSVVAYELSGGPADGPYSVRT